LIKIDRGWGRAELKIGVRVLIKSDEYLFNRDLIKLIGLNKFRINLLKLN
jgi:hypothetical protein